MANKTHSTDEKDLSFEERMLRLQERNADLQERQLVVQEAAAGVQAAQLKQTAPKSNAAGPKISAFNLRGEKDFPMPALKCEVVAPFASTPTLHAYTREEVELLNQIEPGVYEVELADQSVATLNVVGTKNSQSGALERLEFVGMYDEATRGYASFYTKERKQIIPPLTVMLRQILGDAAQDVLTMREEAKRIALPVEHKDYLAVSVGA